MVNNTTIEKNPIRRAFKTRWFPSSLEDESREKLGVYYVYILNEKRFKRIYRLNKDLTLNIVSFDYRYNRSKSVKYTSNVLNFFAGCGGQSPELLEIYYRSTGVNPTRGKCICRL